MQIIDNNQAQVYPWQQQQWNSLQQTVQDQRLPHAMLLTGQSGIGKLPFALALAKSLLCLSVNNLVACGKCSACQLFSASTHPDLHIIVPEEQGKAIKVDQIREMVEKNSLTAHISGIKIHLIMPADKMNISASNSLLKTLEEPSPNTLMILVCSKPELLSATIKSRCQQLKFSAPDRDIAINWLNNQSINHEPKLLLSVAQGAPLSALLIDQSDQISLREEVFNDFGRIVFGKMDPVKIAGNWQKHDLQMILTWLTIWVIDMIRLKYNHVDPIIENSDKLKALLKIASAFSLPQLIAIYQKQLAAGRLIDKQLNKLLLLESLLIPWVATK